MTRTNVKTSVGAITLFVADKERARAFYANAFALEPVFEDTDSVVFKFENTIVNLLRETAAPELIHPVPLGSGSRFQLTIWVENADAAVAELHERGVELLNGPLDRPWGQRTATFTDPDGHVWELAQTI